MKILQEDFIQTFDANQSVEGFIKQYDLKNSTQWEKLLNRKYFIKSVLVKIFIKTLLDVQDKLDKEVSVAKKIDIIKNIFVDNFASNGQYNKLMERYKTMSYVSFFMIFIDFADASWKHINVYDYTVSFYTRRLKLAKNFHDLYKN